MPRTGREKLVLDVRPLLNAKGITKHHSFLTKTVGLPYSFATSLCSGKAFRISNKYLEQICTIMHCTPNDLYHYTKDPTETIGKDHPLAALYNAHIETEDILALLKKMSPQEIKKLYAGMRGEDE